MHQYGVSIQSSTKVRETFRQITQKLWATKTCDLDKLFKNSSFITFHFLGFFQGTFCCVTMKTIYSLYFTQLHDHFPYLPSQLLSPDSCKVITLTSIKKKIWSPVGGVKIFTSGWKEPFNEIKKRNIHCKVDNKVFFSWQCHMVSFRVWELPSSATQLFLVSSRNAPPH